MLNQVSPLPALQFGAFVDIGWWQRTFVDMMNFGSPAAHQDSLTATTPLASAIYLPRFDFLTKGSRPGMSSRPCLIATPVREETGSDLRAPGDYGKEWGCVLRATGSHQRTEERVGQDPLCAVGLSPL